MSGVRPGPSSREGLVWLARVGPASLSSWAAAMGWGRTAVYSHARRLQKEGLVEACPRPRGEGSLVYASRAGVRASGTTAAAMKKRPTPVTWSHWEACTWTAAWLTVRGRQMIAPREILVGSEWCGELRFRERDELRRRSHRPDLAASLPDGRRVPIEVELTEKSSARLTAVVGCHAQWVASGKSAAVIYVYASDSIAERVVAEGRLAGLSIERGTLRVEPLSKVKCEAAEACPQLARTEWVPARSAAV